MKNRIGEINYSTEKQKMKIIEYKGYHNITIEFEDGTIVRNKEYKEFRNGKIRNPYFKAIFNIGYVGEGSYKVKINGIETKQFKVWYDMMVRCYNNKYHIKRPTYQDCTVCDEWHNFQVFCEWFDKNYYEVDNEKIHLDKDILIKGNKVYSPDTCVFVPNNINMLFTKSNARRGNLPIGVCWKKKNRKYVAQCSNGHGIQTHLGLYDTPEKAFESYKIHKEKLIKNIADNYKYRIPKKLYNALHLYQVEITD